MSRIFDALQRSEAERGADLSGAAGATELLQHAERRAASNWETTTEAENGNGLGASLGLGILHPNGTQPSAPPAVESPRPEIFDQFQMVRVSVAANSRLVSVADKDGAVSEAFRLLGVRLRHMRRDRSLRRILVTSTIPAEGKSTVSGNLACSLALKEQQRVLLLEGDVRRPSLSQLFGIDARPGLCEWLRGERDLAQSIYFLEGAGLWFLPAGSSPGNPLELLQSARVPALLDQLNEWFNWVVIDSPPVLPLADTSVWARLADGILLVTRQGKTEKRQLQRGLNALEPQKVIGAVVNSSTAPAHDYYYYRTHRSNAGE